jgi:hypothetical protein
MGSDGTPVAKVLQNLVRLDLWPTWLEIGCVHAEQARTAGARLSEDLDDQVKYAILTEELHAGLVGVTSCGFAFDGFYDTVKSELGAHPDQKAWKKNRTARATQLAATFKFHFKLGPDFSEQLRTVLAQLFDFRSRAIHPTSRYVEPNYRPQIDAGVHPHLVTFSGPHAVQVRALTLEILAWITRGVNEVKRLSTSYRVPGDEELAFPAGPSPA